MVPNLIREAKLTKLLKMLYFAIFQTQKSFDVREQRILNVILSNKHFRCERDYYIKKSLFIVMQEARDALSKLQTIL